MSSQSPPDDAASSPAADRATEAADELESDDLDRAELLARLEVTTEENQRLRDEYLRARKSRYQRAALVLAGLGVGSLAGGFLFAGPQDTLYALGGAALIVATVVYYLTPERLMAASVGETVYTNLALNEASLVDDLGLQDTRVYVPSGATGTTAASARDAVRLFIPQRSDYNPTAVDARTGPLRVGDDPSERGLVLRPSGGGLYAEFRRGLGGEPAAPPDVLVEQLAESLVEQFELARTVSPTIDTADGHATFTVEDAAYRPLNRFDHPIPSFLAVALAATLKTPVEVTVDDDSPPIIRCDWDTDDATLTYS